MRLRRTGETILGMATWPLGHSSPTVVCPPLRITPSKNRNAHAPRKPHPASSRREVRSRNLAENIPLQEFIAEFPLRIVFLTQLNELRQLCIDGLQTRRGCGEQLSPVRPCVKRSQFFFDHGQELADCGPVLFLVE